MFHPLGLFKNVQCPRKVDCNLQNCVFGHDLTDARPEVGGHEVYDPLSAGDDVSPPAKRRRVESPEPAPKTSGHVIEIYNLGSSIQKTLPTSRSNVEAKPTDSAKKETQPSDKQILVSRTPIQLASAKRIVSPPPKRDVKSNVSEKAEKLIPRPVANAPAALKINGTNTESKSPKLSNQTLISWALDEEQKAASTLTSEIYRNAMSQRVSQLKKMKVEDWNSFVDEKINPKTTSEKKPEHTLGDLNPDEEIMILKYLRTNLTGLDTHGYVTKAPNAADIQKAKDTLKTAGGYEVCDRCGVRFQVFPGRDEHGRLTTKGECHYHWAKVIRGQWQKTDHITGQSQASFPCCGQSPGSEGCTKAPTHVFKVTDPKRMAVLLQFEHTPSRTDDKKCNPIAFDCEMAYTTYGMEVIRVTAVSWPQNKEVLDVLVRPYGEILDLNTRFSGVTQEQYTTALSYDADFGLDDSISEDREIGMKPLRKVDSPAAARQLMFNLLNPDTPLIGHAIDNDLNTCRIIHSFVVDTVLLYPHPRGLPVRYGLKMLASMYLNRSIQTGGEAGHDSKEDSIATGDLVRIKVAEKWQMMRLQGWKLNDGIFIPPGR